MIFEWFRNMRREKRIKQKEKELEKLTQDPEYQKILKKYNIKPVDWNQTTL